MSCFTVLLTLVISTRWRFIQHHCVNLCSALSDISLCYNCSHDQSHLVQCKLPLGEATPNLFCLPTQLVQLSWATKFINKFPFKITQQDIVMAYGGKQILLPCDGNKYDRHLSTAVGQAVACATVTQRARVRFPVRTSFLDEVFFGVFPHL